MIFFVFRILNNFKNLSCNIHWNGDSRPLIRLSFECNFVYKNWRYGIFKFFWIFFWISCRQRFLKILQTAFNLATLFFFCFLIRMMRFVRISYKIIRPFFLYTLFNFVIGFSSKFSIFINAYKSSFIFLIYKQNNSYRIPYLWVRWKYSWFYLTRIIHWNILRNFLHIKFFFGSEYSSERKPFANQLIAFFSLFFAYYFFPININ